MELGNTQNINVGVDVGKSQLDIHVRPLGISFTLENSQDGIKQAIKLLRKHAPQRIVVEATGRLEMPFILACADANLPFVIANPVQIRRFAGAIGQRAKNDRLDAVLIANYAETIQPKITQIKAKNIRLMSELVILRNQLMNMQTMEKNRLQIMPKELHATIKVMLITMKKLITKIEEKLITLIEDCPEYQEKNEILQSVPGIGNIAAASIISNVPELGYITNKQAASLIGVAPITKESGRYKGKRVTQGGRAKVRTVLYMAMMSAIQCNPIFKATYQRLVACGKPKKVAIIACVRKMVVVLNTLLKNGTHWCAKSAVI
ncbi:IS110 family transposase [Plesiomonas shigelloides]|uniref:IS110 family transposase n=1 Tax=Plesiomonas shigelloides TaxID=703 RepID=UPI000D13629B|nr:IS110 family transposase [Plesiomonas shigelloides]AVQ86442.1 IS110 family transposase [Plesiomonas shigelloides]